MFPTKPSWRLGRASRQLLYIFFCKRNIHWVLLLYAFPHISAQYVRYGKNREQYNVNNADRFNKCQMFNALHDLTAILYKLRARTMHENVHAWSLIQSQRYIIIYHVILCIYSWTLNSSIHCSRIKHDMLQCTTWMLLIHPVYYK